MKDLEGINQPVVEIDASTEEPFFEAEEKQTVNEDKTNLVQQCFVIQNELDNIQTITEHESTQLKNKERNL